MSRAGLATTLVVVRRVAIVLLFVVVIVRPGFGERTVDRKVSDLEVLVVVDRTRSMAALDWDGDQPRIDGVREDLRSLATQLPDARFALITFGRVVRTELPFTSDVEAFKTAVDTIALEGPLDGTGSLIDRPLDEMRALLQDAEAQYPDRPHLVVFASDGENTAAGEQRSFSEVQQYVDGGAVLGYGTTQGGPMPLDSDLDPAGGLIVDPETGEDAISSLDPDNLETVAGQLGVEYQQRDEPAGLDSVVDDVEAAQVTGGQTEVKYEVTWAAALALLLLLLVELRRAWRGLLTARREL